MEPSLPMINPKDMLVISWLQSPPAVILEPPKIKSLTVSLLFSPPNFKALIHLPTFNVLF